MSGLSGLACALLLTSCALQHRAVFVTIRAIGPSGHFFDQPIWSFVVTNNANKIAYWQSWIEVKGGADAVYDKWYSHIEWPEGVLKPGEGVQTNMVAPRGGVWRAYVEYWPISPEDLKRAQGDADRFGLQVVDFCPREGKKGTYKDDWHP